MTTVPFGSHESMAESRARRIIASSYLPAMYISSSSESYDSPSSPIRYVQLHGSSTAELDKAGLRPFGSPNFITGLAAAVGSEVRFVQPHTVTACRIACPVARDESY